MTALWLPSLPLLSSDEALALEDLTSPVPAPADPWEAPAMATTRTSARPPIDLDEVVWLLRAGETIESVARRLGCAEGSIGTVVRRRGTPEQVARVLRAMAEMKEIRIGLAS